MLLSACGIDLVFVVDSSGSINFADPGNWDRMLKVRCRLLHYQIM